MFGNTFGKLFKITCCGESYSGGFRKNLNLPEELYGGLMTIVDGVPAGIKITADLIQAELDKRKPGQTPLDSPRKEKDRVYIFSGVMEDQLTTGAPVGMIIPNNDIQDVHIEHYRAYKDSVRPGHARRKKLREKQQALSSSVGCILLTSYHNSGENPARIRQTRGTGLIPG